MLNKVVAIDLAPCEILSREYGLSYFPFREFSNILKRHENVDILEVFISVIEKVDNDPLVLKRKVSILEDLGATVLVSPSKRMDYGFKRSDDQHLVANTLTYCLKNKPDFLTLFGADGDFAPMISILRKEGIRTEVVARSSMLATELRRIAYSVIDIDLIFKDIVKEYN